MADTCALCDTELADTPLTELNCHHTFHTTCLLNTIRGVHFTEWRLLQCSVCEEYIFEIEDHQSVSTDSGGADHLYNTNPNFRKDIKYYMHVKRALNKPHRNFKKLLAVKKAEVQDAYTLMKAQYEGIYNTKKDELTQSEEYRLYSKAQKKYLHTYASLRRKYNVTRAMLYSLRTRPGLKSISSHRWYYSFVRPGYMIRKALHLRLRAW